LVTTPNASIGIGAYGGNQYAIGEDNEVDVDVAGGRGCRSRNA